MNIDFWHERWEKGETGFHLSKVNPLLVRWWSALTPQPNEPVWVPLCGKSLDMIWLRQQGHPVSGVELSKQALEAFASEQQLDLRWRTLEKNQPQAQESLTVAEGEGFELFCGDYFSITAAQLTHIRLIYDRAALVALPTAMRQRYVERMRATLPSDWRMLLLTFDYPQEQRPGPPFSVSDDEVRQLFSGCTVEILNEQQEIDRHGTFRAQGLTSIIERVYLISDGNA